MKAFAPFLLAALVVSACAPAISRGTEDARREIQASLQRTVQATLAEDVDAYMAELPPDLKIHDESGAIVTREQQRANVLRDWSIIEKTISLTYTVDDISVQGDTATVMTSQRWERLMLRPDGQAVDTVLTTQRHEETWRRSSGRWYGYDIKELGGEIYVNGKPYKP